MHAIVPAYNEAPTIGDVVRVLIAAGAFDSVRVIDDGSSDGTAGAARAAGASVETLARNLGKGGAMQHCYRSLPQDGKPVAFFDADLTGFTPEHARLLVSEFRRTVPGQVVGLRDKGMLGGPALLMPIMGGERIVARQVLESMPLDCWNGYSIETAINYQCDKLGRTTVIVPMRGCSMRSKLVKVGILPGIKGHLKMFGQMARTRQALDSTEGGTCLLGGSDG